MKSKIFDQNFWSKFKILLESLENNSNASREAKRQQMQNMRPKLGINLNEIRNLKNFEVRFSES